MELESIVLRRQMPDTCPITESLLNLSPLGPNIFLRNLFSKTFNISSSLNLREGTEIHIRKKGVKL
jgi:hypothetical protein